MEQRKSKIGKLLFGIMDMIIVFIFLFPFLWMLSVSLQSEKEITTIPLTLIPKVPQWKNYVEAFASAPFLLYLRNSVLVILGVVVIQLLVMVPAAYAFARMQFAGKNLCFGLVMIAFMTPAQLTFYPIYHMMSKAGLMNTLWPQILPFMTNAFGIFLLRQYFMQIPDELLESARLDNAGALKVMGKIMLPMSKPALTSVILFSFVGHWNDYFWPLIITSSTQVRPLTIGVAMLKDTEGATSWHYIMAGNVMLILPVLIVYLFFSKYIVSSFTYSGIK